MMGMLLVFRGRHFLEFQFDLEHVLAGRQSGPVGHAEDMGIDRDQGRVNITPEMMNLQWQNFVLYPAGYFVRGIQVQASVTVPKGFQVAGALEEQLGGLLDPGRSLSHLVDAGLGLRGRGAPVPEGDPVESPLRDGTALVLHVVPGSHGPP